MRVREFCPLFCLAKVKKTPCTSQDADLITLSDRCVGLAYTCSSLVNVLVGEASMQLIMLPASLSRTDHEDTLHDPTDSFLSTKHLGRQGWVL